MVCTAGSAFAATPEATYNALLDSYANMSILNAPQFPVQGSKGTITLSVAS